MMNPIFSRICQGILHRCLRRGQVIVLVRVDLIVIRTSAERLGIWKMCAINKEDPIISHKAGSIQGQNLLFIELFKVLSLIHI